MGNKTSSGSRYELSYRTDLRARALVLRLGGMTGVDITEAMISEGWLGADGGPINHNMIRQQLSNARRDKDVVKKLRAEGVDIRAKKKSKKMVEAQTKKGRRKKGKYKKRSLGHSVKNAESESRTFINSVSRTRCPFLVEAVLVDEHLKDSQKIKMLREYYQIK